MLLEQPIRNIDPIFVPLKIQQASVHNIFLSFPSGFLSLKHLVTLYRLVNFDFGFYPGFLEVPDLCIHPYPNENHDHHDNYD
jgi:hypothetical protein